MSEGQRSLFDARRKAFDRGACDNGPDEYGNWPCDPKVLYGGGEAECQTCGRVAAWPARHECQRCGSDEWEYVDYGGCSVCRPHEVRHG